MASPASATRGHELRGERGREAQGDDGPCGAGRITTGDKPGDLHYSLLSANLAEAVLAVDRAILPRTKRDLGFHSTLRADGVEHLTRHPRGSLAGSLPCVPAVLAPQRLVRESLFCVEFLLAGSEHELFAAIKAMQGLVDE